MQHSDALMEPNKDRYILHIMLCGFHHKKGCILEFVYPPLYSPEENKNPLELPPEWTNIPSLALPEGAHNYESDSVYFHVESRTKPVRTIFGVSTYRQIDAKSLINKSVEVTRSSVQKSVCLLCTLPLYGILKTKLDSITHSFFAGCDFTKTELLVATYEQLDAASRNITALTGGGGDDLFVDVDLLSAYIAYQNDVLAIVKLLLLERRVLLTVSPASRMANTLIALLSLLPSTVRYGLFDSVPSSADRLVADNDSTAESESSVKRSTSVATAKLKIKQSSNEKPHKRPGSASRLRKLSHSADNLCTSLRLNESDAARLRVAAQPPRSSSQRTVTKPNEKVVRSMDNLNSAPTQSANTTPLHTGVPPLDSKRAGTDTPSAALRHSVDGNGSLDALDSLRVTQYLDSVRVGSAVNEPRKRERVTDSTGFPLVLFDTQLANSFCMPYACLHDLNWLLSTQSRSFLVGCNNPLFTMPSAIKIYDAIVDESKVKVLKSDLSKLLKMSSADLRFLERLETATRTRRSRSREENLFDSTNWEGSDDWIREQFRVYLIQLLRAAQINDPNFSQDFNLQFIKAFRQTTAFRFWEKLVHTGRLGADLEQFPPQHPCSAADSFNSLTSDVKLQVNHYLQSSEHGKKVQATLSVMNEGINRGKQLVSSKLANFLGFGKEAKAKKDAAANNNGANASSPSINAADPTEKNAATDVAVGSTIQHSAAPANASASIHQSDYNSTALNQANERMERPE